jgi:LacI family transcriptional regulator
MEPVISIRDVAERAKVSVGTVSNVLNRPHIVADATKARVHEAIKELEFVRNESARQLRAGASRTIGLVVLDVANPFFTDVARGVEDAANEADLAVILCNSDGDPAKEARYLDLLDEQRVRGVLITPVGAQDERLARLRQRGISVVLLDQRSRAGDRCSVAVDDVRGGELAVAHLLEGGHTRIAFAGGPPGIQQVKDRFSGAKRAMRKAGRDTAELRRFDDIALSSAAGRRIGATIAELPSGERPTAVFCVNDLMALGLLAEASQRGIDVPGELAVIGYDDIEFASTSTISLSSVRQPRHELGVTAAKLLIDEVENDAHEHRRIVFRPELTVRASSAVTTRDSAAGGRVTG